jgi:hypothetical protein
LKREWGPESATAGLAAVIVGTIAWGSTGIFVKEIRLAAFPLTFYRLWLGVVLFGTERGKSESEFVVGGPCPEPGMEQLR